MQLSINLYALFVFICCYRLVEVVRWDYQSLPIVCVHLLLWIGRGGEMGLSIFTHCLCLFAIMD